MIATIGNFGGRTMSAEISEGERFGVVKLLGAGVVLLICASCTSERPQADAGRATTSTTTTSTSSTTTTAPAITEAPTTTRANKRTLSVTPRVVYASAETVMEVTGTDCRWSARLWINEDGVEGEGAQFADSDPQGRWRGQLHIDDGDSPTKSYEVAAECFARPGVITFRYRPVPIEVRP